MAKTDDRNELAKALSCFSEADKILTEHGDVAGALGHVLAVGLTQARNTKLDAAANTLAGALLRAREAELGDLTVELTLICAELELRRGRLADVLSLADTARRESAGSSTARARATLLAARALALCGNAKLARKALAKIDLSLDAGALAGALLHVRADVALAESRTAEACALLLEAFRVLRRSHPQDAGDCLLRHTELLLEAGDRETCGRLLALAREMPLEGRLRLRIDILDAMLADDPDEREILLEDAAERAADDGELAERLLAAAPKIAHSMKIGDEIMALETLTPLVERLAKIKGDLPAALRGGFSKSPLCRTLIPLARHDLLADQLDRL